MVSGVILTADWIDNDYVITYTVSDTNGNTSTSSPSLSFEIDTAAPVGGAVSIDTPIAVDGVVDTTEASGNITVTGTLTIPTDAATTTVIVTVNGAEYPANSNGQYVDSQYSG